MLLGARHVRSAVSLPASRPSLALAQVLSRSHVRMVVWERGAGRTLACGTGACATVVAGVLEGRVERSCRFACALYLSGDFFDTHDMRSVACACARVQSHSASMRALSSMCALLTPSHWVCAQGGPAGRPAAHRVAGNR